MGDDCNLFYPSKAFNDVITGKLPRDAVKKMNNCVLQELVVKLVKYSAVIAGTKSVSMVNYKNKPRWWPRDVLFEYDSLSSGVKTKEFRIILQLLVIRCCEFFKNKSFKQIWLPANRTSASWINDENFHSVNTRGIKRKTDNTEVNSVKKRKTLTSKNESALPVQQTFTTPVKAVVYLHDIFKTPKKPEPLTQQQFLNSLGLSLNNNSSASDLLVPHFSKVIKLHNCPHVPLSSDVGRAIIKRENYIVPEFSTAKKIERLEWYINRTPPNKVPQHYEVTFVNNKKNNLHLYKFPQKQFHQRGALEQYSKYFLRLCKPVKVVLERNDSILKKNHRDDLNLTVVLQRLTTEQLAKYVCKDINICVTRMTNTRSSSRRGRPKKSTIRYIETIM